MKRDDVEALRQLLAKATPGPWGVYGAERNNVGPADEIYVAQCFARSGYFAGVKDWQDNAALIAAAINALPALLDIAEAVYDSHVERTFGRGHFRCVPCDKDGRLVAVGREGA